MQWNSSPQNLFATIFQCLKNFPIIPQHKMPQKIFQKSAHAFDFIYIFIDVSKHLKKWKNSHVAQHQIPACKYFYRDIFENKA